MDFADKCDLCEFVRCKRSGVLVKCGETGLQTIVSASKIKGDNAYKLFEGKKSVILHSECRKVYTRRPRAPDPPGEPERKSRSSSDPNFDFTVHCLLCSKAVDTKHLERNPWSVVGTLEVITTLRDKISARGEEDEWGSMVRVRLAGVSDLVAAEGRYHRRCFQYFERVGASLPGSSNSQNAQGRKEAEEKSASFEMLCQDLESESDGDGQYSMDELMTRLKMYRPSCEIYSEKSVKMKLLKRYGDQIVFTELPGRRNVVCFTGVAQKILCDTWYKERCDDRRSEELRIIKCAAQLIKSQIKSIAYDPSVYPTLDEMAEGKALTPELLDVFMEELLPKGSEGVKRKGIAIKHSIVSASRQRSFLSPLHIGLSVALHRRFGSKWLLDLLHNLGVCSSYTETVKFEESLSKYAPAVIDPLAYIQVVFDNADHNVRTLDGHGTFHAMGGILCVTPKSAVDASAQVPRISNLEDGEGGCRSGGSIPVLPYFPPDFNGYSKLTAVDMTSVELNDSSLLRFLSLDFLWSAGMWCGASPHPGWNGYMEVAHQKEPYQVSSVIPLPFINLNPTNLSTIYTSLMYAADLRDKQGQSYCMVTFDQQLYAKAVPIILAAPQNSALKKLVIRLGGFHLLKSFLGTMSIMAGSGLEECLESIYAKNTVTHMMSGDAYARAIRGHFLLQLALTTLVLESLDDTDLKESLMVLSNGLQRGDVSVDDVVQSTSVKAAAGLVQKYLAEISSKSRTGKLWAQYFDMVSIIRMFIMAERSGNWSLHLLAVHKMLPFFHAANHLNYAKSAQIYLQQMMDLESLLPPDEFEKFVKSGFFAVRRSDKFWAGVWSDMTIEQVLMRSIKCIGGLIHGRGLSDSTISKWVNCTPACVKIINSMETFSGAAVRSSDEHVELHDSRQKRDNADAEKVLEWFRLHNPFTRVSPELVSLTSGRIASEKVNCDEARQIGMAAMKKMSGIPFSNVSLQRKNGVVSLATAMRGMVVRENIVDINPDVLFHRMLLTKQSDEELAEYLTYELKEPPPALFDGFLIRQGKKSALLTQFPVREQVEVLHASKFVVDGGFLLHKVLWTRGETYGDICQKYVSYVQQKYPGSTEVVFDGYGSSSTKDAAHTRRATNAAVINVIVEENLSVITNQETFLANGGNKSGLIRLLSQKFSAVGIKVKQALADADRLIVVTAIESAKNGEDTCIIGQDTDLVVLLIALAPAECDIKLVAPGIKGKAAKVYSSKSCQAALGKMQEHILFLHAATGCDTTSAIFNVGKIKPFTKLKNSSTLQSLVDIFDKPHQNADDIAKAGEAFVAALYPGTTSSLDKKRYEIYVRNTARLSKAGKFDLAQLPPTSAATRQHSLRVYHQVQEWRGRNVPPTDWGWKEENGQLIPVTSTRPPAPSQLLILVSCNCVAGCETTNCTCRKKGIECDKMCGHCSEHGCSNRSSAKAHDDNPDDDLEDVQAVGVEENL